MDGKSQEQDLMGLGSADINVNISQVGSNTRRMQISIGYESGGQITGTVEQ